MKKGLIKTTILCLIAGLSLSACDQNASGDEDENGNIEGETKITMTTIADKVSIEYTSSGTATLDWGDGNSETMLLTEKWRSATHTYASPDTRIVTITGANITGFGIHDTATKTLDVSKNTNLHTVRRVSNNLKISTLNSLLETLYGNMDNPGFWVIEIGNNSSTSRRFNFVSIFPIYLIPQRCLLFFCLLTIRKYTTKL